MVPVVGEIKPVTPLKGGELINETSGLNDETSKWCFFTVIGDFGGCELYRGVSAYVVSYLSANRVMVGKAFLVVLILLLIC